ncbi:hypothetical protein Btru_001384 [Bulinus truncatus]|nr:hypothetical protein Btru_001384 [Bulinus truncatus]
MKLIDLVAHSLPGRKKKTTPARIENFTPCDQEAARVKTNQLRGSGYRSKPPETGEISETSWRGNALYRGLETANDNCSNTRGIVTSISAEGFPGRMLTSRNHEDLMTSSDIEGSFSLMASVSATSDESYSSPYYHFHQHHHHHQHHVHSGRQCEEQQDINKCHMTSLPRLCREVDKKQEVGFFRKSLASFRGKKKQCSKASKEAAQSPATLSTNPGFSVCPDSVLFDRKATPTDKKPVKPKRKGLKGFSKSKENKNISKVKGNDLLYYDSDPQLLITSLEPKLSANVMCRLRECSVESCSSPVCPGSRESSFARDYESTGFDSASLSGYESDLSRDKVHRSRSRIKTNPWLPSPQPSLSGGRRTEICDLRESEEEDFCINERFPRSVSLELTRRDRLSCSVPHWKDGDHRSNMIQRHRSLTPLDINIDFGMNKTSRDSSCSLLMGNMQRERRRQLTQNLNDLNCEPSRETCIVSPNTEFVMLTDNLEQLANNISFEYEDILDSTLECVNSLEDVQSSVHELLTDEESVNYDKKTDQSYITSRAIGQSANSPDSGVGGLTCSDGDELTNMAESQMSTKCSKNTLAGNGTTVHAALNSQLNSGISNPCQDVKKFQCKVNTSGPSIHTEHIQQAAGIDATNFQKAPGVNKIYIRQNSNTSTSNIQFPITDLKLDSKILNNRSVEQHVMALESPSQRDDILSPTVMINERLDVCYQPALRYGHGGRSSKPPSTLSHELTSSYIKNHQASSHHIVSDANDVNLRRSPRPSVAVPGTDHTDHHGEAARLKTFTNERTKENSLRTTESYMNTSQGPVENPSEVTSSTDCHADKIYMKPQDLKFDVSVQTDEWNDSVHTDEWNDSVHTDEWNDSVLRNVQESTRLWLLTGNMQSSADTGYCSLTRDSHIYPDDESLFTSDQEEQTASEKGSIFDIHGKKFSAVQSGRKSCLSFTETSKTSVAHSNEGETLSVSGTLSRSIPQKTVNEMFSNIENQFQEIFHQFQDNQNKSFSYSKEGNTNKSFSNLNEDNQSKSFTCLNGEQLSDSSATTVSHFENVGCMMDVETGEKRDFVDTPLHCEDRFVDHDYVNITPDIAPAKHNAQINNSCDLNETIKTQMNTNFDLNERHKAHINTSCDPNEESVKIIEGQVGRHHIPNELSQEKADYLEFLKDAPLKRTHLKRPLFLVPGLGPVDMSTCEHRNMFSQLNQDLPLHSHSLALTHTGKKQKFKKCLEPTPDRSSISVKRTNGNGPSLNDPNSNDHFSIGHFQFSEEKGSSQAKFRSPLVQTSNSLSTTNKVSTASKLSTINKLSKANTLSTSNTLPNPGGVEQHNKDLTKTAQQVRSLCEDKHFILQTIQQARKDETERQQQRGLLEKSLQARKKECLLESLQELRAKLEIQSRKLNS